ncbi:DUF2461 domain-containing protein [Eubacterium sp.]|uniref:DUF2461 domain-containing protein n=1 Tax=Eubacterium sp. TaxID=142586 RepID=UPI002FC673AB
MEMELVLDYLRDLAAHNNREWYQETRKRRMAACQAFEALISELMVSLRKKQGIIPLMEPKKLTFKMVRDTRFSHDKSPYNPVFRAHIGPMGKQPIPVGYFLMISPENQSFLGGGLFADLFKDATTMVRDAISSQGREWEEMITAPDFKAHFTVKGKALKRVPQGYDKDHPQGEYLKNKSWYLEYPVSDRQILKKDFIETATDVFMKMQDFNDFLNRALEGFEMPTR